MALFIGKASERALKATSNCIKNSLRTTTSKNKQFDGSNHSVPRKNAIWCSITLNNCNYQGEFRSLSTSTSYNSDMYFTKKHEWVSVVCVLPCGLCFVRWDGDGGLRAKF